MLNRSLCSLSLTLAVSAAASAPVLSDPDEFIMPIMDAFAITGRGAVMTGRVESGSVETGDTVCVPLVTGEVLSRKVEGIELFRKELERAEAGQTVGILVSGVDIKQVKKGEQLTTNC